MKLTRLLALMLAMMMLVGCLAACGDSDAPTLSVSDADTEDTLPADTATGDGQATQPGATDSAPEVSTSDSTTLLPSGESTDPGESTSGTSATRAPGQSQTGHSTKTPTTQPGSNRPQNTTTTKAPSASGTTGASATAPSNTKVTTTVSSKHVMTYTTTTAATTTTKDKTKGKSIKILAIGNSFSVDAMNNHLYDVLASAGYTDIILGNLYIGGCSLDTHYANLKSGAAAYEFYLNTDNYWEKRGGVTLSEGLGAANWDFITVQQVSNDSGRPTMYSNLKAFMALLKQKKPRARFYWHMTWAYQQNSSHWGFAHYDKDQMTMYKAIVNAVQKQVLTQPNIDGVIPAGTAIQNLRTSALGDTLTSDGHHLKDTYGDYTAALTWFCALTGEKLEKVKYRPATIADNWDAIAQSVENALKKPYQVTKCK